MSARIITFYSYKGGTGRTMSLANTAWILASQGKRVLVVDWDLEAPGLHRYFHPFLPDRELRSSPGVMDLVWEFATAAMDPATPDEPDWHERLAAIQPYAMSVEHDFPRKGAISLIPAGRQDHLYSALVTTFDWNNFYERLGGGGFIEAVKRSMREHYDYVLIDSRTGLSDTAGICTVQLPDILVNCFTLSTQAIDGAEAVAASVHRQRANDHLRMLPVPMRVDTGEADRLEAGRAYARAKFGRYLSHVPDPEGYWGDVEVPYQPIYAYEEVLATVRDTPQLPSSVLAATERLVAHLTDREITSVRALDESLRRDLLRRFTRVRPEDPEPSTTSGGEHRSRRVFITYAYDSPDHFEAVRELWYLLRGRGVDARLDRPPGQRQAGWPEWQREQLLAAELVLPVSSPGYRGLPPEETAQLKDVYYAFPDRFLAVVLPGGSPDSLPGFLAGGPAVRQAEVSSLTAEGVRPVAALIGRHAPDRTPPLPAVRDTPAWGPRVFDPVLAKMSGELSAVMYRHLLSGVDVTYPFPLRWSLSRKSVALSDPGRMALSSGDLLNDDPIRLFASLPHAGLVLLGAAGAGKTTAVRRLATELLDRWKLDGSVPVPVMLSLVSWDPHSRTLTDWLAERVERDHPHIPREAVVHLLEGGWILPILDGLDELPDDSRTEAISTLHRGIASEGMYVLTSRTAEYESAIQQLGRPLNRATVLELDPLSPEDMAVSLSRTLLSSDRRWDPVFHTLSTDRSHPLAQVLTHPLMLQLAAEVYRTPSTDPTELLALDAPDQIQKHLLRAYVPAVYGRHPRSDYSPERAGHWLTFLAAHLDRLQTSDFAWWELHRVFSSWGLRLRLGFVSLLLVTPLLWPTLAIHGSARVALLVFFGAPSVVVMLATARSPRPLGFSLPFPRPVQLAAAASPRQTLRSDRRVALLPPLLIGLAYAFYAAVAVSWNPIAVLISFLLMFLPVSALMLRRRASPRYAATVGWLAATGRTPWRLMRFLEDAHARGVLRRSGAVYQFRHARLQEVLAEQAEHESRP